jgi:hypothetical protein
MRKDFSANDQHISFCETHHQTGQLLPVLSSTTDAKATDKQILRLLDKPPPEAFARWTGPLLAEALGDVDVQYVWRFLRGHKIDLAARKSWCRATIRTLPPRPPMLLASVSHRPRRPLCCAWTKSLRSELWSERRAI